MAKTNNLHDYLTNLGSKIKTASGMAQTDVLNAQQFETKIEELGTAAVVTNIVEGTSDNVTIVATGGKIAAKSISEITIPSGKGLSGKIAASDSTLTIKDSADNIIAKVEENKVKSNAGKTVIGADRNIVQGLVNVPGGEVTISVSDPQWQGPGSGKYALVADVSHTVTPTVTEGWITSVSPASLIGTTYKYIDEGAWGVESTAPATSTPLDADTCYKLSKGYYEEDKYFTTPSSGGGLSGNAAPSDVVAGKTFCNASGAQTGTLGNAVYTNITTSTSGVPFVSTQGIAKTTDYISTMTVPSGKTLTGFTNNGTVSNYGGSGVISSLQLSNSGGITTAYVGTTSPGYITTLRNGDAASAGTGTITNFVNGSKGTVTTLTNNGTITNFKGTGSIGFLSGTQTIGYLATGGEVGNLIINDIGTDVPGHATIKKCSTGDITLGTATSDTISTVENKGTITTFNNTATINTLNIEGSINKVSLDGQGGAIIKAIELAENQEDGNRIGDSETATSATTGHNGIYGQGTVYIAATGDSSLASSTYALDSIVLKGGSMTSIGGSYVKNMTMGSYSAIANFTNNIYGNILSLDNSGTISSLYGTGTVTVANSKTLSNLQVKGDAHLSTPTSGKGNVYVKPYGATSETQIITNGTMATPTLSYNTVESTTIDGTCIPKLVGSYNYYAHPINSGWITDDHCLKIEPAAKLMKVNITGSDYVQAIKNNGDASLLNITGTATTFGSVTYYKLGYFEIGNMLNNYIYINGVRTLITSITEPLYIGTYNISYRLGTNLYPLNAYFYLYPQYDSFLSVTTWNVYFKDTYGVASTAYFPDKSSKEVQVVVAPDIAFASSTSSGVTATWVTDGASCATSTSAYNHVTQSVASQPSYKTSPYKKKLIIEKTNPFPNYLWKLCYLSMGYTGSSGSYAFSGSLVLKSLTETS